MPAPARSRVRPDPDVAARLLARLDVLDDAKAGLAAAAGPEALLAALDRVDGALASAAGGTAATRTGRDSGRRTPAYLDCRRDLDAGHRPRRDSPRWPGRWASCWTARAG